MKRANIYSVISIITFSLAIFLFSSCSKPQEETIDVCAITTCVNGTKVAAANACTCKCDSTHKGAKCDSLITITPPPVGCSNYQCGIHGTAVTVADSCGCNCALGYMGARCDSVDYRAPFLGTLQSPSEWSFMNEICNGNNVSFGAQDSLIASTANSSDIIIRNFEAFLQPFTVHVNASGMYSTDTFRSNYDGINYEIYNYHCTLSSGGAVRNYSLTIQDGSSTQTCQGTMNRR